MRNLLHEQVSKKTYCSVSLDMLAQNTGTTAEGNGQVLKNMCNFLLDSLGCLWGQNKDLSRPMANLQEWPVQVCKQTKSKIRRWFSVVFFPLSKISDSPTFLSQWRYPCCEDLWQHNTLRGLVMKQLNCLASKVIVYQKICRQDGAKFFILIIFKTSFFDYRLLHHLSCKLQTYKKIYICILSFLYVRLQWAESGLRNINNILHIRLLAK